MKLFCLENLGWREDEVEVDLGFGIPDLCRIESNIAVEVQHSPLSYESFMYRNKQYWEHGIYVLWIFDECLLTPHVSDTLKKAHEIFMGRVYIFSGDQIVPVHFEPTTHYVPETEYGGGYERFNKKKKRFNRGLPIVDFTLKKIDNSWKDNNAKISRFLDKKWWSNGGDRVY